MAEDKLDNYFYDIYRQVASSDNSIPDTVVTYHIRIYGMTHITIPYDLVEKKFIANEDELRKLKRGDEMIHAIKNDLAVVQMQKDLAKLQKFNEEQERERRRHND